MSDFRTKLRSFEIYSTSSLIQHKHEKYCITKMASYSATTARKVEIKNLNCFTSKGHQILTNVNFTANPGEFLAIMGPSGSGKTTLLNFVGNHHPGKLDFKCDGFYYGGQSVDASFWNEIKFVHQEDSLHGFMTVEGTLSQYVTLNYGFSVDSNLRE
jgi:ABC-type multidrug transport system ATPase subunit